MNGSSKHTLYGVIFIATCLLVAGIVYAVIRSPAPAPVMENTSVADMHVDLPEAASTPVTSAPDANSNTQTAPRPDDDGAVQPGPCGTDECSWSKTLSRDVVQADTRGRLIKLTLLGGSSRSEKTRIIWNDRPHSVYVFCSTALPAVMLEDSRRWQVDVLDLIDGVPGVLQSSVSIYADACHPGDKRFPSDAETLGYAHVEDENEDVQIDRPTDIFDRVSLRQTYTGM